MNLAIEVNGLTKSYKTKSGDTIDAVKGIDLHVAEGEILAFLGSNGAGKTTTCAKLAKHLRDRHGKRPMMVDADVKRPAAVEQLRVLGRSLDIPVFHLEGAAPPRVCEAGVAEAAANGCDVVILDTAGRLHVDELLMDEVAEIAATTKPHNQVLVVDAMTGQDAVDTAERFHQALAIDGDDRGTTRMVQHFEVGAMAVGQLDGVDGHACDTAREHLARADQHQTSARSGKVFLVRHHVGGGREAIGHVEERRHRDDVPQVTIAEAGLA